MTVQILDFRLADGTDAQLPAFELPGDVPTSQVFVFRPGATGILPANVYTTEAALDAAVRASQGPRIVQCDGTASGGTVHFAANHDWRTTPNVSDVTLVGDSTTVAHVTIDGTLGGVRTLQGSAAFTYTAALGAVPCINISAGFQEIDAFEGTYTTTTANPFFAASGTGDLSLNLALGADLTAGHSVVEAIGAGSFVSIATLSGATIGANSLSETSPGGVNVAQDPTSTVALAQAGLGGALVPGITLFFLASTNFQNGPGGASPAIQAGSATLVAGVSAAISATITATSRIVAFIKTMTPGAGNLTVEYGALTADRTVGAPGSFKITALIAAGTINVNDTSVLDWIVIN